MEETNANWRINKAPHGKEIARCKEREREREREAEGGTQRSTDLCTGSRFFFVFFRLFFLSFLYYLLIYQFFLVYGWGWISIGTPHVGSHLRTPFQFGCYRVFGCCFFSCYRVFLLCRMAPFLFSSCSFDFLLEFYFRHWVLSVRPLVSFWGRHYRILFLFFVLVFCFFVSISVGSVRLPRRAEPENVVASPFSRSDFVFRLFFSLFFFFVFISVSTSSFLVTELFFVCYHVLVQLVSFFRGFDWSDRIYWVLLTFTGLYWF